MARLANKTAIITGAAQGMGRATAELFMQEGAKVIAVDINEKELQSLEGAVLKVTDITDQKAIQAMADEFGAVDIIFNCAGYVHQGSVLNCSEKDLDFSWSLNVKALYFMLNSFIPHIIKAKKEASIINMASVASNIIGVKERFAYAATKAAVIGLTKAIAADHVQDGIRCNAVAPGTVESPSLEQRINDLEGGYDEIKQKFVDRQPMGRLGTALEIAYLVLHLASDESRFTTASVFTADGGFSSI